jgi:hypothetical protein
MYLCYLPTYYLCAFADYALSLSQFSNINAKSLTLMSSMSYTSKCFFFKFNHMFVYIFKLL